MTRDNLAEAAREKIGLSKTEGRQIVDLVLESVVRALERGKDVKLTNFGAFEIQDKGERVGRNPRTGETASISARRTIKFRASTPTSKVSRLFADSAPG